MTEGKLKILVTGGSGFTGGHLCKRLAAEGHIVRTLARNPSRCESLREAKVEIIKGDLCDLQSIEKAMKDIDIVYHIAAMFREGKASRKALFAVNLEGTRSLLDTAIQKGVQRFIHCSTIGVHGDVKTPPANEESPYAPCDDYQDSKTQAEILVIQYMKEKRLPIVIFRPGAIYGPGDLRFLKLYKAIQKRRFIMIGSGETLYQMVYIDDLINGILICGQAEKALGNIYILNGDDPVSLNKLVKNIAQILQVKPLNLHIPFFPVYFAAILCEFLCKPFGISPPLYRRRVNFFRKTRCFDVSKSKKELGFRPKVDLNTGLKKTAEWYKEQGLLR